MNFGNNTPDPRDPMRAPQPMENGANPFGSPSLPMPVAQLSTDERLDFIRKTYSLFMGGILFALLVGWATLNIESVFVASMMLRQNIIVGLLLLFGLCIGAQAVSRVPVLNLAALFTFAGFMGFFLTPLLWMFESRFPGIVGQAGGLTVLAFGSLTAYAFISKKDFSFLGGLLFVGLVMLILGGLANMFFFKSSLASYAMAWVGLLLFSGYVLYDTSNIMRTHDRNEYVSAALGLFINFINMFLSILRILAGSRSD